MVYCICGNTLLEQDRGYRSVQAPCRCQNPGDSHAGLGPSREAEFRAAGLTEADRARRRSRGLPEIGDAERSMARRWV